ncbi:efflux RND transporter periplasmic adaptor subunit [Bradyrhizobium sp. WYCCWR 13023]|uniref:Efflux RND transporter periplasmic adaptor subunit n=1 Tax=Bradyrhizobium zhengyangense TaxID=2911009 RepID=A0A9X1R895_9BRAD|nr:MULTISPECIES: efflux RND transporter periplasmic adaptor subunit [Bradyrhizobium]MCG2625555.1 efflux RND transporter periplasmic adaptor subunit [Bradyrhizobium zhengyangense]MCG2641991.1 efflux RND transporter periplasmic adaptor subunit [Bradyrhizobium zhengyangense]MCG2672370.1 efflux RND transporter periplasmic adaptor subunit [Bradyrhizobium zhengyangense]MDA9525113.1 hemolysin secretion protein D [Bradyrhizobium sp. CCBAU 11434]
MVSEKTKRLQVLTKQRVIASVVLLVLAGAGAYGFLFAGGKEKKLSEVSSQSRKNAQNFTPTPSEWATLTIEPVNAKTFRAEYVTEGKVAVDEDRSTPVFSPYAGRVTKLLAKPGESVTQGQPLFTIEAADTVQAQNDFIAAMTSQNKAKSALELADIQYKRAKDLYEGRAIPLKDYQQAEATQVQAQNDMRSAVTALEAANNKLRILGFTDETIKTFQNKGTINPEITIYAPLSGTVVQRKIGPGQYVSAGASDPVFVIGDLSTVWLTAFVRESDAAMVSVGQDISVNVMALPGRPLTAKINYVATAIDPNTRRLLVRATIDNKDGLLKPEMFANVTIYSAGDRAAPAVPKQALIYEGDQVRIWVAREDKSVELRQIKIGLINGNLVEVTSNLKPGEQIVVKGSLFIDRAASGS